MTPEDLPGPNLEVNEQACHMLGYTREELLAMSVQDLVPGPVAAAIDDDAARLLARGRLTFETENRRRDGTIIPVEVSAYLHTEGNERCVVSIVRDISARKRDQARIQALVAEKENLLREVQHRIKIELLDDQLYHDETHGSGSLALFLERLVAGVVEFFGGTPSLQVETTIADIRLPEKALSTVGLIVNELVTNAMKYGFAGRQSVGFGLTMVQPFVQQLGGTIRFEDNRGITATVTFPLSTAQS